MRSPWLWAIVGVALVLRLTLLLTAPTDNVDGGPFTSDSRGYVDLAEGLVEIHVFQSPETLAPWADHVQREAHKPHNGWDGPPEVFRTPGYPLFLAPTVRLGLPTTCPDMAAQLGLLAMLLPQILLDCGLVVLTYLLGLRLLSHKAGLLGAFFQAISPLAIASSCRVLSDSLYAFLLTAVMLLLARHFRLLKQDEQLSRERAMETSDNPRFRVAVSYRTWKALAASALVLGAATYVRPIGQMMAAGIAFVLLCGRRGLDRAIVFVVIVALCLSPWIARNLIVADYHGFSTFAYKSFINYTCWRVFEDTHGIGPWNRSVDNKDETLRAAVRGQCPGENEYDYDVQGKYLLRLAAQHPGLVAKYHLQGAVVFWLPGATDVLEIAGLSRGNRGTLSIIQDEGLLAGVSHYFGEDVGKGAMALTIGMVLVYGVQLVGLAIFAAVGVRTAIRNRFRIPAIVWVGLLLLLLSMLAPGPASHPRFRVPLEPMLNIAAACGYLLLGRRKASTAQLG